MSGISEQLKSKKEENMIHQLLSAITGYIIGYILVNCCAVYDRDQLLIMCTTLLAMQIAKEIKEEWGKWS